MRADHRRSERLGKQHPDFNRRPDSGVIWLNELVIDPRLPERIPAIKISVPTLWRNIDEGLFPRPVLGKRGWNLGQVRAWISKRDALNPATASPYDDGPEDGSQHPGRLSLEESARTSIGRSGSGLPTQQVSTKKHAKGFVSEPTTSRAITSKRPEFGRTGGVPPGCSISSRSTRRSRSTGLSTPPAREAA